MIKSVLAIRNFKHHVNYDTFSFAEYQIVKSLGDTTYPLHQGEGARAWGHQGQDTLPGTVPIPVLFRELGAPTEALLSAGVVLPGRMEAKCVGNLQH